MRLTTVGRRSGRKRSVILGYYEDGPNLITMAMNGWKDAEPAWWLNLQAHPDATVELTDSERAIHGRAAEGEERQRLWGRWRQMGDDIDGYATRRPSGNRGGRPRAAVRFRVKFSRRSDAQAKDGGRDDPGDRPRTKQAVLRRD